MGNIYMIGKIDGKVVDLTDVQQIMVHGSINYDKAEKMLNSGISVEQASEYFCTNCGGYIEKYMKCKCLEK